MSVGSARHRVTVENPYPVTPDGGGGYTETWYPATPPEWQCSIERATARELERVSAGTTIAGATHILKGRYHPGLSLVSRVRFGARVFLIVDAGTPEERQIETVAVATEVLTPEPPEARR